MPKIRLILTRPLVAAQLAEMDADRITLGRSKSCTLLVDDRFLSRTHAELVARDGKWFIRDCGSANGTFVNGVRIDREVEFRFSDSITMGDTEIRMGGESPHDEITQVGIDSTPAPAPAPPPEPEPEQVPDLVIAEDQVKESAERTMIVHRLALELLAERSTTELFEIIVEHVMEVMRPSRVAIVLLGDGGESLEIVKSRARGTENADDGRLSISQTLLSQIIEERKVVAYTDVGAEGDAIPESMLVQGIYSALGAPLLVSGRVLGVLYLDYRLTDRVITEDDAQLAAQIARVAAIKLESSGLRPGPGMNKPELLDLYRFNDWANARFATVVRALEPEMLVRDLGGSYRCIRDVLSHIVSAEWVWLERWNGSNPSVVPDWVDSAAVSALLGKLSEVERGRRDFFDGLAEEKLREPVEFRLLSGESRAGPLIDLMLHVVDHSTYHRGQLASMLRRCGVAPPATSLIEFRRATG